ncbi:hypothetical protein [Pseudomonas akapageensis]|uniref:hypothetical protein n=1 Tax=Pseudomonas akapageensis TaxID=2609961 RepID=UPI00140C493D|nr:hypothetical protein [Pseudomonas akapageensis]
MSLGMTIFMLIVAWLAVAAAMLWGVMRITRRHHHHPQVPQPSTHGRKDHAKHVSAH